MSSQEVKDGVVDFTKTQAMPSPTVEIHIGQVAAEYVDEAGNEISSEVVTTGEVGSSYSTTQKTIEGYTFVRVEGSPSGVFNSSDIVVTYIYRQVADSAKTGTVTVKYVDEAGNEISSEAVTTGEVGNPYSTTQRTIKGYTFVRVEGSPSGVFNSSDIVVTYVYKKDEINTPGKGFPDLGVRDMSLDLSLLMVGFGVLLIISNRKKREK